MRTVRFSSSGGGHESPLHAPVDKQTPVKNITLSQTSLRAVNLSKLP